MGGLLLACLLTCVTLGLSSTPPLLILSELCYYPLNLNYIRHELENITAVRILPSEEFCDNSTNFLHIVSTTSGDIFGSIKPELCSTSHALSNAFNTTLVSWNCPQDPNDFNVIYKRTLSPTIATISKGISSIVTYIQWKSVALITTQDGWWTSLSQSIDLELRIHRVSISYFMTIQKSDTKIEIAEKLYKLSQASFAAILVCMPSDDVISEFVMFRIEELSILVQQKAFVVLLDVSNLPHWRHRLVDMENKTNLPYTENYANVLTGWTRKQLLFYTTYMERINENAEVEILRKIDVTLDLLRNRSVPDRQPVKRFALYDMLEQTNALRLLAVQYQYNYSDHLLIEKQSLAYNDWTLSHSAGEPCVGSFCHSVGAGRESNVLMWIFVASVVLCGFSLGVATLIRAQLIRKRVTAGPHKILLAASDFVFPQLSDSRRVDEGIEAMLCCWLQQLQEFGGPEVEKPDLIGSLDKTPIRGGESTPSLSKNNVIMDPRVRYNGDLVQLKPVPSSNNAELKERTVHLLLVLHGLRHENLNPIIGCLAESPRASIVSEYCTRGSLQDVLQQDDIKLDWAFRLSLLTDLVRGMKYLHSTQVRVHGYLTSRNCVIDARWVLKLTDYGLPAIYEAQGLQHPPKTARELLWTAPELLRHSNMRKKGTQPGDVYSFGIILQEVVVRGEPFCMLALTAEEIIEKVKRPPPLIRPSVSKGAAPPEAINIMRQCWAEQAEMRPDFNIIHDQFKKLNHGRKVNIVDTMFQMLEKYSNNLEELIKQRTEQLDLEKKKTEQLLNRMLPNSVAEKLKLGMPVDPEEFENVTIYFSDIVGFTTISAHSTPFQVVDLLNELYTCFDATINAYNVYKVETIGDAYMVVGGLPVRITNHAEQIATMALDLLHQSGKFKIAHLPGTPLRLRIGLHTGSCCAGVVGLTMPRYCLFGDTVNTASRMESTGAAWRIHLSETTKAHLERAGGYHLEYRGPTEIKGKGTMHTYWLLGREGFSKPLPTPPTLEESHGLEESLIINNLQNLSNQVETKEVLNASNNQINNQNPTFVKTMEYSKFINMMKTSTDSPPRHEYQMVKSTSSEAPISLNTAEMAAAMLGASTSSLCGFRRHFKIQQDDLSTPYNHYKCLSPKQQSKLLRRQFSLDKAEKLTSDDESKASPRKLFKQNSAGAADLEKIDELPIKLPTSPSLNSSSLQCTLSISIDSIN